MSAERLSLESRVRVSEDVVFREMDGEAVLLNLGTGIYFGLNKVGTHIWNLLQQDGSLRAAFETMRAEYKIPAERLEEDLLSLANQLCEKGLLEEHLSK